MKRMDIVESKELTINNEYNNLLPPLSSSEYSTLKQSIKDFGLFNPIITNGKGVILDGYHRYKICKELKVDISNNIIVKPFSDLLAEREFVVEINLKRRQLNDFQKIELGKILEVIESERAKQRMSEYGRIGALKQHGVGSNEPTPPEGKTIEVVARRVGVTPTTYLRGSVILDKAPEPLKDKLRKGTTSIAHAYNEVMRETKNHNRNLKLKEKAKEYKGLESIKLIEGDFKEVCKQLTPNSIDLILTDPPYGEEYLPLWEDLGKVANNLLKPSGFLVSYSGQTYLPTVLSKLSKSLNYFWCSALIHTGSTKIVSGRNVINEWKPILIFYKSPPPKIETFHDVIKGEKGDKQLHEWAQSVPEARTLISIFSKPNDLILDPFVGSGTTLAAAFLEKRQAIGIEKEHENIEIIKGRLTEIDK